MFLQGRRLTVAKSLAFAPIRVEELQNCQVKITESAIETFGTWREGRHDDLVLAIACAAWVAEHWPVGRLGMWFGRGCMWGIIDAGLPDFWRLQTGRELTRRMDHRVGSRRGFVGVGRLHTLRYGTLAWPTLEGALWKSALFVGTSSTGPTGRTGGLLSST